MGSLPHPCRPLARWSLLLVALAACGTPDGDGDGWTVREGDCDDDNVGVQPLSPEFCANGLDDDCDGLVDGDDPDAEGVVEGFEDADGDGYGGTSTGYSCEAPAFTEATDCDDANPDISPAAAEICGDGLDNDCDRASLGCPGIGADEASTAADTLYLALAPGRLESEVGVLGRCGDLDGDGAIDVLAVVSVWDAGEKYYGEPKGDWMTLAVFDGSLRGSVTTSEAWARPIDALPSESWSLPGLACTGDTTGDARSELAMATAQVGDLEPGVHLLAAPDRGDLEPEELATWPLGDTWTWLDDVDAAGDVDGDGRADLLFTPGYSKETWAASLLSGAASGRSSLDQALLTVVADDVSSSGSCAGADGDGDGTPDIGLTVADTVYVFSGGTRGRVALADADVTLTEPGDDAFGFGLGWVDDPSLGPARLTVGRWDYSDEGALYVGLYQLDPTAPEGAVLTATLVGEDEHEPWSATPVGDVDGDGALDLAVVNQDDTWILPAPREGTVDVASARMGVGGYGPHAGAAGDVDDDGYDDVLVSFFSGSGDSFAGLWLGGPPP